MLHEHMAPIWDGSSEERYAQVSCFLPVDSTLGVEDIYTFREKLNGKLLEISLEAEDGKSLYVDAYSAKSQLTLRNKDRVANVTALGVNEDYFFFHNLLLRSGSYLTSWDVMQDRVVLDENTAWTLFGSFDVAGMEVTIDNRPFVVAGVVKRNSDPASKLAEADSPSIVYVDYSLIQDSAAISCYEIVMPSPLSDYAKATVEELFPLGQSGEIIENSSRFRMDRIAGLFFSQGERMMQHSGIAYPSWENAARYQETKMGWLLLGMFFFALLPASLLVLLLILLYCRLHRYVKQKILERRISA
ncbi:MAG: ABC transporter permease [Bacillota bacterium]|nr:ABC transporter permease [Bacillota bacterium]